MSHVSLFQKVNPDRQKTAADDVISESMIVINNPVNPADILQSFCAVRQ